MSRPAVSTHSDPAQGLALAPRESDAASWSVARGAAEAESPAYAVRAESCRAYVYPVYAFLRRSGAAHADAADRTQGIFAWLVHTGGPSRAEMTRGRLRTFLLSVLTRRLPQAGWRGADAPEFAPELAGAEERYTRERLDPGLMPEEVFNHHWAMATIERAIATLRAEYTSARPGDLIDALGPFVWGGSKPPPQSEVAATLGMTEHAFTVAVHRLRHRLRVHLHAIVAETVIDPADVDAELRFLLAVVRRRPVAA